jgi:hypothetical protein
MAPKLMQRSVNVTLWKANVTLTMDHTSGNLNESVHPNCSRTTGSRTTIEHWFPLLLCYTLLLTVTWVRSWKTIVVMSVVDWELVTSKA